MRTDPRACLKRFSLVSRQKARRVCLKQVGLFQHSDEVSVLELEANTGLPQLRIGRFSDFWISTTNQNHQTRRALETHPKSYSFSELGLLGWPNILTARRLSDQPSLCCAVGLRPPHARSAHAPCKPGRRFACVGFSVGGSWGLCPTGHGLVVAHPHGAGPQTDQTRHARAHVQVTTCQNQHDPKRDV